MNSAVNEMTGKLSVTKAKTRTLIDETTHLQKQVRGVETKQNVSAAILEKLVSSVGTYGWYGRCGANPPHA